MSKLGRECEVTTHAPDRMLPEEMLQKPGTSLTLSSSSHAWRDGEREEEDEMSQTLHIITLCHHW